MTPEYDITCPVCGAPPKERCRTLKTNRTTDTHLSRIDAEFEAFATRTQPTEGTP